MTKYISELLHFGYLQNHYDKNFYLNVQDIGTKQISSCEVVNQLYFVCGNDTDIKLFK